MQNDQFNKSAVYLQSELGTHTAVAKALGVTPAAYRIARGPKGPSSLMWFATCAAALLRKHQIELPFWDKAGKE